MYHFLHKHRYWFVALVAIAVGSMIIYSLTNDEEIRPGENRQDATQVPAAP
jgi:hypothetical protein